MHPWATAVGSLLTLVILWDAFQTIILSRRVSRRFRPTRAFYRLLWTPWRAATKRIPPGNRRENILMVFGPLSLLFLIALWALGLIVSFAFLHWGLGSQITGPDGVSGFGVDLYMSGTTFFTLGLGDVTPRTTLARGLTILESGMGFGFLALVIGYVPLISQAFSRREVSISMLDARAGSPPTAARLLRRHVRDGDEDLRGLLRDWERWSAELLESHVSFPVLSYFRSQHDNQSWVAALTTILDVCSLVVARIEDKPVPTARLTFAMARHAVVDLCAVFRHVQVYAESRAAVRTCHLRSETPMEKREGDDQAECPDSDQQDQRERAEYRENVFPSVALGNRFAAALHGVHRSR